MLYIQLRQSSIIIYISFKYCLKKYRFNIKLIIIELIVKLNKLLSYKLFSGKHQQKVCPSKSVRKSML